MHKFNQHKKKKRERNHFKVSIQGKELCFNLQQKGKLIIHPFLTGVQVLIHTMHALY